MTSAALTWLVLHQNKLIKAILGLAIAVLLSTSIVLRQKNKTLSESLERALNNIEAYLGSLLGSLLANNVLLLTVEDLLNQNDKLIYKLDSIRERNKIKQKNIKTAATLTQLINVIQSKPIVDTLYINNIYKDTIRFNDLTVVACDISKDTITIGLDVRNTQYLFVYTDRHYKNKKSFLKRLFTFDFKKVSTTKYLIENTNDLILTDSVKVIEISK